MLKAEETVYPREEHTTWLFNTKWSALKTHIQVTLYRLSRLYVGIDINISIYIDLKLISDFDN